MHTWVNCLNSNPVSASYYVEVGPLTSGCLVSLSVKWGDDNDTHGHGVRSKWFSTFTLLITVSGT